MAEQSYKYWAFISYSHQDRAWANWLHKSLETYRVPHRLVGREHWSGPLPRRLVPIFRDREELPSSAELGSVLNQALEQSRYLIVICSAESARSRWVNEEVKYFKSLGRSHRVLPIIIGGEPNASEMPHSGLVECLPQAIRFEVDANGELTERKAEPIAADARGGKDGRANAKLKLIAGLLSVGLDELKQRERQRTIRNRILTATAGISLVLLAGMGWQWQQNEKQRALQAQELKVRIAQLYENGRQELLAHNEARAAVYLNEAYKLGVDTPALRYMLARAMRVVDAQALRVNIGSPVISVSLSSDGKHFLAIDRNYRLSVWSTGTGQKLGEYDLGQTVESYAAIFSPNGAYIWALTDHSDEPKRRVRILSLDTKQLVKKYLPGWVNFDVLWTAFDENDQRIAYLKQDLSITVYSLNTQRELNIPGRYSAVRFCKGQNSLIAGTAEGAVLLLDPITGHVKKRFTGMRDAVITVDSSKGCKTLAAGGNEGALRVWDIPSNSVLLTAGHTQAVNGLQINTQGTRLISGTKGDFHFWNVQTGALIDASKNIDPRNSAVPVMSLDGDRLARTNNSRLVVSNPDHAADLYSLDGHRGSAQSYDFGADSKKFITAAVDGSVVIWRLPQQADSEFKLGRVKDRRLLSDARPPEPMARFDNTGQKIAVGGGDGVGALRRSDSPEKAVTLIGRQSPLSALAFSPDGATVAVGDWDQSLRIYDANSGKLLRHQEQLGGKVHFLSFAPNNRFLSVAVQWKGTTLRAVPGEQTIQHFDTDSSRTSSFNPKAATYALGIRGAVQLWDLNKSTFLWSTPLSSGDSNESKISIVRFSPDGSKILASLPASRAFILDASTGKIIQQINEDAAAGLFTAAFSSDGSRVALGDYGKSVLLWQLSNNAVLKLRGHTSEIRSVSFSADGALLVSGAADGTLRVWDAAKGDLLDVIAAHDGSISWDSAQFNPQGDQVLSSGADNTARLWAMKKESRNPEQIAALLRCRVAWRASGSSLVSTAPDAKNCMAY